jgi:hypothetical protein
VIRKGLVCVIDSMIDSTPEPCSFSLGKLLHEQPPPGSQKPRERIMWELHVRRGVPRGMGIASGRTRAHTIRCQRTLWAWGDLP